MPPSVPDHAPLESFIGLKWASADGERQVTAYSAERERVVIETRKAKRSHFLTRAEMKALLAQDARTLKTPEP